MPELKLIILKLFRPLISEYMPTQRDQIPRGCFTEKIRKEMIEIAEIASGKPSVDLGAGTRFISEGLIQKGVKVIAVD